jgi:hypothetical protein
LRSLASFIGIFGIEFIVLQPGSICVLACLDPARKSYQDAGFGAGFFLLCMLTLGGCLGTADSFYQRDAAALRVMLQASCMAGQVVASTR